MSKDYKFCKDCKHFGSTEDALLLMPNHLKKCTARDSTKTNPVDGTHPRITTFASISRQFEHLCGPQARYFEPQPKSLFRRFHEYITGSGEFDPRRKTP